MAAAKPAAEASVAPAPAPTLAAADSPSASHVAPLILQALAATAPETPLLTSDAFPAVPFADLKAALDRLASRAMITYHAIEHEHVLLEPEGAQIAEHGSHEARVFEALRAAVHGLTVQELEREIADPTVTRAGQGKAFREKWIAKRGDRLVAEVAEITDLTRDRLRHIRDTRAHEPAVVAELRKRKLVRTQKRISFTVLRGPRWAPAMAREETDLTAEMLASGAWKTSTFKPYNFRARGADQNGGTLHPLYKVRTEIRQIFFELGFAEMPTSHYVETAFWNFEALYVAQQHPARALQDTFFISDPQEAERPRKDFEGGISSGQIWDNVRAVHQDGRFDSLGHRYPWSEQEALKLVLRTHTTGISAKMLWKLAARAGGPDGRPPPARYFSIDRVFRNESVDQTHLAEFHQIEGVIADYNLTLGGLMEFMTIFFGKMGLTDLKFKPAYNPYTEPSLEIYAYHPGLGKLVEIGNSGMFRPEMLRSLGLPPDMRVYGWGLSLERPTMIKYGISNIRDLVGHKVDLNLIYKNPAVRLDQD